MSGRTTLGGFAFALSALLCACPKPAPQPPDAGAPDAGPATCPVTFRFHPQTAVSSAAISGEWSSFLDQDLAGPDSAGEFTASLQLAPGTYAYDLVTDGQRGLDPTNGYRKYAQGTERSALRVPDCRLPSLRVDAGTVSIQRPSAGAGAFQARLSLSAGIAGPSDCRVEATLRSPAVQGGPSPNLRALTAAELSLEAGVASVSLGQLADGKYTVSARPICGASAGETVLLPFWIQAAPFSIEDTPLYMAMTDRFRDGDPTNDPAPQAGAEPALDYHGGDLRGVELAIRDGYFDQLGIRAIWLTPWQTQPTGTFLDKDGAHPGTGYHGYWPVRAREVDPRLGGAPALRALVEEAHRHGIRIVMDAVLNHVHRDHEYYQDPAKRLWFRTGCVCGTTGCDWTAQRLSCLFTDYMPDIDWTVEAASEQFLSDVLWWLEEFDLDGLRLDAVKHIEDLGSFNLATRVRERFGQAGTEYFMMGETAMGWAGDNLADNALQYDTISHYLGPLGLDGQLDFVLYHAVPYRVFAWAPLGPAAQNPGYQYFLHADYWTDVSQQKFAGSTMVNFIGSHDGPRFVSLATYRDQNYDQMSGRRFTDLPQAPADSEPYDRLYLALLNLTTLPGVPLIYYGDEYGEFGGGDPDNRHPMRFGNALSAPEKAQLARTQPLLQARGRLRGLSRGPMIRALVTEDLYAYARPDADPGQGALVVVNRVSTVAAQTKILLPPELGWTVGTVLSDALGGPGTTVVADSTSGRAAVVLDVPARGGAILSVSGP